MNPVEYQLVDNENDTYPAHTYKWIVRTYTHVSDMISRHNHKFYRNFGPFNSNAEASKFLKEYREKYTTKGFITMFSIEPICSIIE